MKKQIIIILAILLIGSVLFANTVAVLSSSKGKVELSRNNKKVKFKNGELLNDLDVLKTGAESFATYKYIDASSTVKLFANSIATIKATKEGDKLSKTVNVRKGSVYTKITPGTGAFKVQTPTTVASVKGTDFLTTVAGDGTSTFNVFNGEVEIEIPGKDGTHSVGAGQTGTVAPDGSFDLENTPENTPPDEGDGEEEDMDFGQTETPAQKQIILIPVMDEEGNRHYIEIKF